MNIFHQFSLDVDMAQETKCFHPIGTNIFLFVGFFFLLTNVYITKISNTAFAFSMCKKKNKEKKLFKQGLQHIDLFR